MESSDEIVDSNSGLLPFRKSDNTYWSSHDTEFLQEDETTEKCTYERTDYIAHPDQYLIRLHISSNRKRHARYNGQEAAS